VTAAALFLAVVLVFVAMDMHMEMDN